MKPRSAILVCKSARKTLKSGYWRYRRACRLEKAGFVRTQVLVKAYEIDGVYFDDWVYRLEYGAV